MRLLINQCLHDILDNLTQICVSSPTTHSTSVFDVGSALATAANNSAIIMIHMLQNAVAAVVETEGQTPTPIAESASVVAVVAVAATAVPDVPAVPAAAAAAEQVAVATTAPLGNST